MYYHLPGIDPEAIDASYQRFYFNYTRLMYPPEPFYFGALNQNDFPAEITIFDVY